MVWLRPIGSSSSSAPALDDAAAPEDPTRQQLEAALAQRDEARRLEYAGILEALSSSEGLAPSAKLTRKQLEAMRSRPSPYSAGVVGAAANPRHDGKPPRDGSRNIKPSERARELHHASVIGS